MKMTGKEALQHIENLISNDTYYLVSYEEEFKAINKDLEELETLKKYKELKEKLKTPSDIEKSCMPEKKTYEDLEWDRNKLREQLRNRDSLIFALEHSLMKINDELISSYKEELEVRKEQIYELRKQLRDN